MGQELIQNSCGSAIRSFTIAIHGVRLNYCAHTPKKNNPTKKVVSRNTHNKLDNLRGKGELKRREAEASRLAPLPRRAADMG